MKRKLVTAMVALGIATGSAVVPAAAMAKITTENTSCQTGGGGNLPPGQQPTCTGGGLTQNTQNENPAGHAPPGQNT